ncbi:MAG: hypothetical protein EOP84_25840 [Verrucomicrobiaceae bacterium]|nr:MAG: hypothetical protein EOP84_25840 [Verrucomicrobiaceae bacterium]
MANLIDVLRKGAQKHYLTDGVVSTSYASAMMMVAADRLALVTSHLRSAAGSDAAAILAELESPVAEFSYEQLYASAVVESD